MTLKSATIILLMLATLAMYVVAEHFTRWAEVRSAKPRYVNTWEE